MDTSKMNTKAILSFIVATVIALVAVSSVLAAGNLPVSINEVSVDDVSSLSYGSISLAAYPGDNVPVVVRMTPSADLSDIKVTAWIEDQSASTDRFDVLNGSTYNEKLTLTLPSVDDMSGTAQSYTLFVRVEGDTDYKEATYKIQMQRDSYALNFLFVDAPSKASAGEIVGVDVALQNTGARVSDNTVITASIPELGIYKRMLLGDVYATDDSGDDQNDARSGRLFLTIPADVKSGDYNLEVRASNSDTSATSKKVITVTGLATQNTNSTAITPGTKDNGASGIPTSIIVLTVILVIIFVVLLVVLIVLLTKKPTDKVEDFGETSYY